MGLLDNDDGESHVTMPIGAYIAWLNRVTVGDWKWMRNSDCKHVTTRFDARTNRITVLNRDGVRVSAKQLHYQSRLPPIVKLDQEYQNQVHHKLAGEYTNIAVKVEPRINVFDCLVCHDPANENYELGMCCGQPMKMRPETEPEYQNRLRYIQAGENIIKAAKRLTW